MRQRKFETMRLENNTGQPVQPELDKVGFKQLWNSWSPQSKFTFLLLITVTFGSWGYFVFFYLPSLIQESDDLPIKPEYKNALAANNVYSSSLRHASKWPFLNALSFSPPLPPLADLIHKMKINYDASFLYKFSSDERLHFEEVILRMTMLIRNNLAYVIHPKMLWNILSDPNFSIYILPKSVIQIEGSLALAGYAPITNKVVIGWDPDITEENLRMILRNEFHHAAIRYRNLANKNNKINMKSGNQNYLEAASVTPAVNTYFQDNDILINRLNNSIDSGLKRIREQYEVLIKNASNNITINKSGRKKLNKFINSLEDYDIQKQMVSICREEFEEFQSYATVKRLSDGRWFIPAGDHVDPRPPSWSTILYNLPFLTLPRHKKFNTDRFLRVLEEDADQFRVEYSCVIDDSPLEKAKAFIAELNDIMEMYDPGGSYHKITAGNKTAMLAELSSHIEQFPEAVKKLIFPEWCQYFEDYLQIKDYCYRNAVPRLR
jgi:hypothetical protein